MCIRDRSAAIRNLNAARLASDVAGTDTVVIARTDAESAKLLSSDVSDIDKPFIKRVAQGSAGSIKCRTSEGFYQLKEGMGLEYGCVRGQAYAEYADLVWCETSKPCLKEAKRFADAVKGAVPDAMLAYNCSPSFNWEKINSKRRRTQSIPTRACEDGFRVPVYYTWGISRHKLCRIPVRAGIQGRRYVGIFKITAKRNRSKI